MGSLQNTDFSLDQSVVRIIAGPFSVFRNGSVEVTRIARADADFFGNATA
jgi:hypothetical protein